MKQVIERIALSSNEKKYAEFPLLLKKWKSLTEIVYILKIPYDATIDLQKRDLTLSDTYCIHLKMKLHLKDLIESKRCKTGLETLLLSKIQDRHDDVFDHPAMRAALYLDPRFRHVVTRTDEDTNDAINFIVALDARLNSFKNQSVLPIDANDLSDYSNPDLDFTFNFNEEQAFDEFIQPNSLSIQNDRSNDFRKKLEEFNPPKLTYKSSVLEFWLNQSDDELREVALALYSIPPTETEVERDFSALKFIFSDLRSGLSNETLEDIICIYLNKKIYLQINEEQIKNVKP